MALHSLILLLKCNPACRPFNRSRYPLELGVGVTVFCRPLNHSRYPKYKLSSVHLSFRGVIGREADCSPMCTGYKVKKMA